VSPPANKYLGLIGFATLCCLALVGPVGAQASAAQTGPQWTLTSVSRTTNFTPGDATGADSYRVTLTNTGGVASDGSPVQVTDELPQGLSLDPTGASGVDTLAKANAQPPSANFSCALRTCTYTGKVVPDQTLDLTFPVDVAASPPASCAVPAAAVSCVANVIRVSGGGAPAASIATPTVISEAPAGFGIPPGGATTALSSLQAGGHPDITNTLAFNTVSKAGSLAGDPKDVIYELPPGFASDFVDTPSCPAAKFVIEECPIATQIGVTTVTLTGALNGPFVYPVYNLDPNPGEVAKLGFFVAGQFGIQGGITVRPGDYGADVTFHNTNEVSTEVDSVSLTVWGVPADAVHDPLRCELKADSPGTGLCTFGHASGAARAPFFTNPTTCGTEPLHSTFRVNSWQQAEQNVEENMLYGPIVGCDRLGMEPSLIAEATTNKAYSPTGLNLSMDIPQTYENPDGLATSTLKRAVITLPEGMTVNPSAGAGLGACTQAQYEEEPVQPIPGRGCPSDSKLGTIKVITPLLKEEVLGSVYLAQPYANQFGSLIALFVVARIPDRGVLVKFAGKTEANPETGQLVTTFDDLPPLPFRLSTFRFNQGATSPLVTPPTCGSYTVGAQLTPWATPSVLLTPQIPPFPISSAFDGGPCPSGGVPPFAPQVSAGTLNNSAGAFSPLDIRIARNDGEQEVTRFSSQLPAGLTANLSGVAFCPDQQIEEAKQKTGAQEEVGPSCPAASEIGHTLTGAGVGSVLAWAPGKLYMAGPYNGAPFSIVAITRAKVGPFDLGTVVVREALKIDPHSAVVTVDASASDPIPHIIKGIVVHVRDIRVYVDRAGFTLNPTSCQRMTLSATVSGSGANFTSSADDVPVTIHDPFQAANCQNLAFKPTFKVSTSGKTSRANGASLNVKLTYPKAPQGTQANIAKVKVSLPKQLPSRLTTLQKACLAAQFEANPAGCPAASIVGHARAITPILPVPLEGPAYFVSHGGEAFPSLIMVLQGYGVTIDLVGATFINKSGITSSTFNSVPDQPVSSFELNLPQGRFSALTSNASLCSPTRAVTVKKTVLRKSHGHVRRVTRKIKKLVPAPLQMPTAFTAQNGMVIHQNTKISVTGCPKAKKAKKAKGKKPKRK
jgi:uncharacterized repeat protein (TIGR01451 family)